MPPVDRLCISPDGRILAGARGTMLWVVDLEIGGGFTFEHDGETAGLALSASNVAVGVGRRVHVYNVLAGRALGTARCRSAVDTLRFDGVGERLYAWHGDVRTVFRALTLRKERGDIPPLPPLETMPASLRRQWGEAAMARHPDGVRVAVSLADGVRLLTAPTQGTGEE